MNKTKQKVIFHNQTWGRLRKASGRRAKKKNISVSILEGSSEVKEMWKEIKIERKDPEDMSWRRETETQKVEDLLLEWCKYHFSKTDDTPLSSPRWRE